MHTKTLSELSRMLDSGETSSEELTRETLDRIKTQDSRYNSFITLAEDQAMNAARQADEQRASGNASALTGVPYAHKDIFCTRDLRTTCGSRMLDNFVPPYNSTVAAKLDEAGAVCVGKTNMDEFAMGSSNETSYYGPVTNPWGDNLVPGGSSGGSAAAVAARLVPGATATDTGGSIRQPAALCGLTGLKPTYGRVSRYGIVAFASSLDQAGTLTRTAEDSALMLNAMAGFDPKDSTCMDRAVPDYTKGLNNDIKGLRIGLPAEFFSDDLDPIMARQVREAIREYENSAPPSPRSACRTHIWQSRPTTSSPPPNARPTCHASTAYATATAARTRRTSTTSTCARARKASAKKSNAASSSAPTPCPPASSTPTTSRPRKSAA